MSYLHQSYDICRFYGAFNDETTQFLNISGVFSIDDRLYPDTTIKNIKKDPFCKSNIAELPEYKEILTDLHNELIKRLKEQRDPRVSGNQIFDSYPRYSTMRNFPGFNKRGTYNPEY